MNDLPTLPIRAANLVFADTDLDPQYRSNWLDRLKSMVTPFQ